MTRNPHSIELRQTVAQAVDLMREHHVRHLPVVNHGTVVGVISERDITFGLALNRKLVIEDLYTADPYLVTPDTAIAEVADRMARERIGCAVVIAGGDLAGIFTSTDACRLLADVLRSRGDVSRPLWT